jgi:phospholipid/cholesterol/gamma-HCH transport system substrate-binding protein
MSKSRFEWKVGLFVTLGLVVMAALVLNFSKGLTLFQDTYLIRVKTSNVGAIKQKAAVLMSGVPIGSVQRVELSADGKFVTMYLKILEEYKIYHDARFAIESMGLLGDQVISIRPRQNTGGVIKEGEEVTSQEPFDLQEVGRASVSLIQRLNGTVEKIDTAVSRVSDIVLSPDTLTNLSTSVGNMRKVSEQAIVTMDGLNALFSSNAIPVASAVSNLVLFSGELNQLADQLGETINTNRTEILFAVKNVKEATAGMKDIVSDVQQGKGTVGALLRDEQIKLEISQMVNNLTLLSSNLNKYGLLYKPKKPRNPDQSTPLNYEGKRPLK